MKSFSQVNELLPAYKERIDTMNKHLEAIRQLHKTIYDHNAYTSENKAFERLHNLLDTYKNDRSPSLKEQDAHKEGWYLSETAVGMTLYIDLFAGDLEGILQKIGYFKELGVTFIHFMPLLEGRPGENDGGYAVADYKAIDSKFGTMKTFKKVIKALHEEQIHTCIDFVINHTAKEHEWAKKALEGKSSYMDLYMMYEDDTIPNAFNETLPEVFPQVAPGNFTYFDEINRHVLTSFYPFQWDLNFKNPEVLYRIVDILLYMANLGVDMIRLDAIPFMWKELGTRCRNLPHVHLIMSLLHHVSRYVAPSVALLGEAIVEPEEIVKYFGEKEPECDIMYNATYMVNIWNAIATRDTRLMTIDQNRLKPLQQGCWINYARCHDDIGWGFNEEATKQMGFDPFLHKQFLIQFYEGQYPGSFSKGELYEYHEETQDARNSGTLASLCGLEVAYTHRDLYQQELATKRILLIHALLLASSGLPLIYSGDELATINDYTYKNDLKKAHDSRWLHRPFFDWERANKRHELGSVEGLVFQTLKKLITLRKTQSIFASTVPQRSLDIGNPQVYVMLRENNEECFIGIFNFSEYPQWIQISKVLGSHVSSPKQELYQGKVVDVYAEKILVGPYEFLWLL
jgi:amylosucrase